MTMRPDRLTRSGGRYGDSSTVSSWGGAAEELQLSMDESRGMLEREVAEAQVRHSSFYPTCWYGLNSGVL